MASDLSRAVLLYRAGQPRDFPLPEGDAILGFGGESAVHLPMEGISRSHAKVSCDGKDYWIEDLGSSNGTFLNGIPVAVRERLRHLDVLTLGRSTDLIFVRRTMEHVRVTRPGIRAAWLVALNGEESGSRVEIPRGTLTIGRSPSNALIADSQLVSKIHARLERTALQVVLTDLHSSNGTFMGSERIDSQVLKDGDEFTLGGARSFRVNIEEGDVETSGVTPSATMRSHAEQSLPTDWKTRIEWTPEEFAVWEDARKKVRMADTATRRGASVEPGVPQGSAAQAPAAKPAEAPARAPAAPVKETPPAPPAMAAPPRAETEARVPPPPPVSLPPKELRVQKEATPDSTKPLSQAPAPPAPRPARPSEDREAPPTTAVPSVREGQPATPAGSALASPAASLPSPPSVTVLASTVDLTVEHPKETAKDRIRLEGKTRSFLLSVGEHEVGRLPGMSVCLDSPQISRHHAVIRVTENDVIVEDRKSGNGTFVNMERITAQRRLNPGDLLQFGDLSFHVQSPSDSAPERET